MDYINGAFWLGSVLRFVLCMYERRTISSILVLRHVVYIFLLSNLESLLHKRRRTYAHAHTHTCSTARADAFAHPRTPFKCSPSRTGLAPAFQLTLFPLQMTASTWEMSGSLCQHCLASSNICEVLSSSLQLRRAVSRESRLMTRNTAKTAQPSALKHIHSARSFASTKDCISRKFVVFKAALSPRREGACVV